MVVGEDRSLMMLFVKMFVVFVLGLLLGYVMACLLAVVVVVGLQRYAPGEAQAVELVYVQCFRLNHSLRLR